MSLRALHGAVALLGSLSVAVSASAAPPKLTIIHFDVNVGDATLIISPDGHGVLVDAGNTGRGVDPIVEYIDRAKQDGLLASLDYTIVTHYDADHLGGMDEVLDLAYPTIAAYDRGNKPIKRFDNWEARDCVGATDADRAKNLADWGTADEQFCDSASSCSLIEYLLAANDGGKRQTLNAGDVLDLDHSLKIVTLVANAKDIDGNTVDVFVPGRRRDCAENDLSIGLLVKYGDFRYLIAGDLTGDPNEGVADVEALIKDDAQDIDVYHVNHHGSRTSSSDDFLEAIHPRVAIVSNGGSYCHPSDEVVSSRLLDLDPAPAVYLTNKPSSCAWDAPGGSVADHDRKGYDGMVEVAVWKRTYRVYRWEKGQRIDSGDRYRIKAR